MKQEAWYELASMHDTFLKLASISFKEGAVSAAVLGIAELLCRITSLTYIHLECPCIGSATKTVGEMLEQFQELRVLLVYDDVHGAYCKCDYPELVLKAN